ncbi:MAG: hypothetical protein JWQ97_885 [Phenylobacterium sp.]|nr:hypothetical protein [Phenylobacterium sp.]
MLFILPVWVTLAVSLVVIGFALARGRRTERLVAALTLADLIWGRLHPHVYGAHPGRELAHDAAQTAILTLIALRSDRYWTLAAASICLVSAGTDVAQMISPVNSWAVGTAQLTWYYAYLAAIAVGAWRARASGERRAGGVQAA